MTRRPTAPVRRPRPAASPSAAPSAAPEGRPAPSTVREGRAGTAADGSGAGTGRKDRSGAGAVREGRARAGAAAARGGRAGAAAVRDGRTAAAAATLRAARTEHVGRARAAAREVVSRDSAALFAERARRVRRRVTMRAAAVVVAFAAVVAVGAWVLLESPLARVRQVGVVGAERIDPAMVQRLADPYLGEPLVRVPTGPLEREVEALQLVREAEVVRVFPASLEVRLVERVPVAAVASSAGVVLIDGDGLVVADSPTPPPDLPLVEVDVDRAGSSAVVAVAEVLAGLPETLATQVARAGATSADDVWLRLTDDSQVLWGSAERSRAKAAVVEALRHAQTQPVENEDGEPVPRPEVEVYDVRSPDTPVTR